MEKGVQGSTHALIVDDNSVGEVPLELFPQCYEGLIPVAVEDNEMGFAPDNYQCYVRYKNPRWVLGSSIRMTADENTNIIYNHAGNTMFF